VIDAHPAVLAEFHEQPLPAVTPTVPVPPDEPNDALDDERLKVHAAAA
jgi:hypothetical protein